jgi:dynein heavy chain 1
LGNELQDFHTTVSKSRTDLESQSVEASSTSEAVSVITYVQSLKRKLKDWEKKVDSYTNAQKVLERQRYQFPSNWLYSDYIQGEWGAFNEILKRKDSSIQNQVASLQAKVISEEKIVENRTNELIHEWDVNKPVTGTLKPDQALKNLQVFETKFNRIKEERDNMLRAKDALELRDDLANSNDIRITVSIEELQDLKGVWSELTKIWSKIDEQKEKQWLTVQPRKLRSTLEALATQLREMPSRLRQYDSYNYVKKLLQDYTKANMLISELKSEALKERHWKQLMKRMNVSWNLNDLTLGQIWDINLLLFENIIRDVLMVAQGEKALEEFLKQVTDYFTGYIKNIKSLTYICCKGERTVEKLHTRADQLPEQMPDNPRLGRSLQQAQRAHKLGVCDETLTLLQRVRRRSARLGRQTQPHQRSLRRLDRRSTPLGLPRRNIRWQRGHQAFAAQ